MTTTTQPTNYNEYAAQPVPTTHAAAPAQPNSVMSGTAMAQSYVAPSAPANTLPPAAPTAQPTMHGASPQIPAPAMTPPMPYAPPPPAAAAPVQDTPDPTATMLKQMQDKLDAQEQRAAISEFMRGYDLPQEVNDTYQPEDLASLRHVVLHYMASEEGQKLMRHVISQAAPELLGKLTDSAGDVAPALQQAQTQHAQPTFDANAVFASRFGLNWDQVRGLPNYHTYVQQVPPGSQYNVEQTLQILAASHRTEEILNLMEPLIQASMASRPAQPSAPISTAGTPSMLPQNNVVPQDPNQMVFDATKLQPLIDKAGRHGLDSLTSDERLILDAADAAQFEGRVT